MCVFRVLCIMLQLIMASLQASSPGVRELVKGHPVNYLDFGRIVLAESSQMCKTDHSRYVSVTVNCKTLF